MATGGGVKEVGVRLKVGATGLENASALGRSLRELGVDTSALDTKAEALGTELAKLGAEQRLIDNFARTKTASLSAAQALAEAQAEAQKLGREFGAIESPTRAQTAALDRARTAVTQAKEAQTGHRLELQQARAALQQAGIGTDNLAAAQVRVSQQTAAATSGMSALTNQYRAAEGVAKLNADSQTKVAGAHAQAGTAAQKSAGEQAAAAKTVASGMDGIGQQLQSLGKLAVGGVLGAGTLGFLKSAAETADSFNNLKARMSLVTGEGQALGQALQAVEQIALRTGASLESTGTLFTRVLTAGKDLGLAQADALKLTESINQAIAVSGASASAGDAAITQLIQGLQSGVLRGDEFNSVMEQAPRLAQAMADGLGVTRGQLRGMAQDGQLSSETVIRALRSQSQALETEFGKLPATVGRSIQNLNTAWTVFVGNLDRSSGATSAVAAGIESIAKHLDDVAGLATRAGAVLLAAVAIQGVGALKALAAEAIASAGSMGILTASIDKVPKVVNIAIAVTGFEIGYQIGTWLHENSELARKLGIGLVDFFNTIVNGLQFAKEAAAAVFTSDTIDAAFDRMKKRAEEQRAIFADMYADAARSPEMVRLAADSAAAQLQKTGDTAKATGATIASAGASGAAGVAGVGRAAEGAAGAIGALTEIAKQKLPQAGLVASQQAAEMARLAEKSHDVAQRLATEIPEAIAKLSGPELAQFRDTMKATLAGSEQGAKLLTAALVETGKRAAQALGVDVAQASTTLTKEFVGAQENLALLINALPQLKTAGVDTGRAVGEALAGMVAGAKNQTEFDALKIRIEALGKAGLISKTQVADLLDALRDKARTAAEAVDPLTKAYEYFGLKTKAQLQAVADDSQRQWKRISDSGTASLDVQRAAFTKYADDAIAANGGIEPSWLRNEALILKSKLAAAGLADTLTYGMHKARDATDDATDALGRYGRALDDNRGKAASRIGPAEMPLIDENGRTPDQLARMKQQGGPIDASYNFEVERRLNNREAFAASELPALLNGLRATQENINASRRGTGGLYDIATQRDDQKWQSVFTQAIERARFAEQAANASQAPGKAGAMPSSSTGATAVNITINGQPRTVNTATAGDAAALASLLAELEAAANRSGP